MKTFSTPILMVLTLGLIISVSDLKETENEAKTDTVFTVEQLKTNHEHCKKALLSSKSLKAVPSELNNSTQLTHLDLSNNFIVEIPSELGKLKKLETLNLSKNKTLDLKSSLINLNGSNINKLNLSNCDLTFISYEIRNLDKLKHLDVSNNHIIELPLYLKKLKQLEHLNLSHNQLESLDFTFHQCKNLKEIYLDNNPDLDIQNVCVNLMSLKNLSTVKLSHLKDTLPLNFGAIKTLHLHISESNFSAFPTTMNENAFEEVTFDDCKSMDFDQVFLSIQNVESLTSLNLNNSISEIPNELKSLKQLKSLDLSHNHLKKLELSQEDLPELKELRLYGNDFSDEEWQKIYANFPNCNIISNNQIILKEENISIEPEISKTEDAKDILNIYKPLIENVNVDFTNFSLEPKKEKTITVGNSTIHIPKNAFLNSDGKVVKSPVEIAYREFHSPLEVALSGIPMKYDSSGTSYVFESAGMFEFRAFTEDGVEVFPNPNQLITVDLNSKSDENDFNLYKLDDATQDWTYLEPSPLESVNNPITISPPIFIRPSNKPELGNQKVHVNFNDKKNKKLKLINISQGKSENEYDLVFPNIHTKGQKFVYYDDELARKELRKLKRFLEKKSSSNKHISIQVEDYKFDVNKELDCYEVKLILKDTILSIPLRMYGRSISQEREQKDNLKYWKNYTKSIKSINKENEKTISRYEKSLDKYETALASYQEDLRNWSIENKATPTNVRTVVMSTFGVWNCDRIARMEEPRSIAINLLNGEGKSFNFTEIIVLDFTDNGSMTYRSNRIDYDAKNKCAILAFDDNNNIAFVNHHDFEELKTQKRNANLSVSVIKKSEASIEELVNMIY